MGRLSVLATLPQDRARFWAIALTVTAVSALVICLSLSRNVFATVYLPKFSHYLSDGKQIWLNAVSDLLIGAALLTISFTLAYLMHRVRRDIPFRWMFLAFGLFMISCGMVHFMEAVALRKPLHWFLGDLKLVTALAAVATAVTLPRLVAETLALIKDRRVKLEQANDRLQELNRRLIERDWIKTALVRATAGVVCWEVNCPGGQITWSEDPAALFGRTALSSLRQWEAIVHPEDRPRLRELFLDPVLTSREYDIDHRILWPDGSVRWLAVRARTCRETNGAALRLVGLAIDITHRKQAEETLRTSEKLATAGRLAATIAHEINNPLEAVTNLLFLMRTNPNPDYLKMAEQELARINQIAKQTLGFYRIDTKPTQLILADVIAGVLGLFRDKIVWRKVQVGTSYRSTDEITGYSNELRQVFGNLIGNALDAMSSGGRLLVRTVSYHHGVRVTIADNGSGIARESLSKIFQPFFTANKEVGTGLGLWLAREIVQKHRGTIHVRSSTDPRRHGTVFMIWLPSAAVLAQANAA